jgi:hypothetical protein
MDIAVNDRERCELVVLFGYHYKWNSNIFQDIRIYFAIGI